MAKCDWCKKEEATIETTQQWRWENFHDVQFLCYECEKEVNRTLEACKNILKLCGIRPTLDSY